MHFPQQLVIICDSRLWPVITRVDTFHAVAYNMTLGYIIQITRNVHPETKTATLMTLLQTDLLDVREIQTTTLVLAGRCAAYRFAGYRELGHLQYALNFV